MAGRRKLGRRLLAAALLATLPSGCKNGIAIPIWNPFARSPATSGLQQDSDGGYIQDEPSLPSTPRAEEFGWDQPFKKLGETLSAPFKKTAKNEPAPIADDDPISLTSKNAPPGPELYVSLARLQEKGGNVESAVAEYKKALAVDANHLQALLGLARLYDRQGEYEQALTYYRRAVEAHPDNGSALNDLGLCYARCGKPQDSIATLKRAVAADPKKVLYRNNLATMLVDNDRDQEAYQALVAAHGEAVAHYNVGFLLNKRGLKSEALAHFKAAAKLDPSLEQARQWVELLGEETESADAAESAPTETAPAPKPSVAAVDADHESVDAVPLDRPIPTPIVPHSDLTPKTSPVSQRTVTNAPSSRTTSANAPPNGATPSPPSMPLPRSASVKPTTGDGESTDESRNTASEGTSARARYPASRY